ncbi:MAG: PaaX domain-containing protein, C- domain protein [Acidimicrobiia bacterium]
MTQDRNTLAALGLRPMSARSVVASVLLGSHPPELPVATLVHLCSRFGIAEGTTRVAMSRMVAAGELGGVGGNYRLVGEALLSRQRAQDEARHPPQEGWDGSWRQAVVVSGSRSAGERAELRRAFAEARFAEWREGVWLRPANLPAPGDPRLVAGPVRWLTARPADPAAALAGELWDLSGWAEHGRRLLAVAESGRSDLSGDDAASIFAEAAAILRHLRTDPLLPLELLPSRWPADDLRASYTAHVEAIQRLVRDLSLT